MGYEDNAGLNSYNHYGVRTTGGAVGVEHGYGAFWTVKIDLTGQSIADNIAGYVPPFYTKKGMVLHSAVLRVDEVFVVGGTTPHVEVGASGSAATNGVVISDTQLETLGSYDITATGTGTWATSSFIAADAKIGITLEGDTTVSATAGKGTLILQFVYNTKI